MNTKVRSVRNSGNLSKYQLFYYEPGCRVFIKVIHWLYKGQCPIEHLVVDLAKYKQIPVDENEKEKIFEELKKGINGLHNLTLPLLYKITQSVCGLANRNENVWTKKCPINKRDTLEYRLFKLIDDRSHVDHLDPTELKQLLKSILLAAGEKSKVDQQQIEDSVQKIENDIEQTCHENIIDVLFYDRCGSSVIIQIIHWLYEGKSPINDLVIDLIRYNEIKFDGTEKGAIEELERSNNSIGDLDITTLYKIIQTVCGLADRNDVVWTRNCPSGRQGELEHLLFKLKDGRNSVSHIAKKLKNISDSDVDQKSKEMEELLSLILKKAGEDMDVKEVDDAILFIQEDVEGIRKGSDDKIDATMKPHVLNIILNDLKSLYEEELKSSFQNELKGYSAPYLHVQESNKTIPLKDLLTFDESPVIIIQGEAGEGKSSLTRFLFYSWLSGDANSLKELTYFDIVLKVECSHVDTRDMSQFLEDLLPIASYSFPNTSSLKKHLDDFRVLWVFDGFDESTGECKSFLKSLIKRFPEAHRLIITTRPFNFEELITNYVNNIETVSLSLELLQNDNIEEITRTLIPDDHTREDFRAEFRELSSEAATFYSTPINMILFVELWLGDRSQARGALSTEILFVKTMNLQLSRLEKRLEFCTNLQPGDLKKKLEKWFYGSLCKQSFLMVIQYPFIMTAKIVENLEREADDAYLLPSYCLSTFLAEIKVREGACKYNFRHIIQKHVLACLFLRTLTRHSDASVTKILKDRTSFSTYQLLFIIEKAFELDSINNDVIQICNHILDSITTYKLDDQHYHLCKISVASKFNVNVMKKVANAFSKLEHVNTTGFRSYKEVVHFLKYVHPKKIIITADITMHEQSKEEYLALVNALIKPKLDIIFHAYDKHVDIALIDLIKEADLNITSLFGNTHALPLLRQDYVNLNLKSVELEICCLETWSELCQNLQRSRKLDDVNIEITFDTSPILENVISFPKLLKEFTTLTFRRLVMEYNFSDFITFVQQIKGDNDLKFKELRCSIERISFQPKSRDNFHAYFSFVRYIKGDNAGKFKEIDIIDPYYKCRLENAASNVVVDKTISKSCSTLNMDCSCNARSASGIDMEVVTVCPRIDFL